MTRMELVGLAEVAGIAKSSRGTVRMWRLRGYLPPPITELACGPIWERKTIEEWWADFRASRPR